MVIYPDPDNPGAEIQLNNAAASRVWPDGRREWLPPAEEERWYRKLRADNEKRDRKPHG
jgi:hypothetical protein